MGTTERREREKEQRRSAIVDAAEKVFFSRGIAAATMDDVAAAAELSKGTLYLYFKSKEELYAAIVLRAMDIMKELFVRATATPGSGIDRVNAMGVALYRFSAEHPDYFLATFHHEAIHIEFTGKGGLWEELHQRGDDMFRLAAGLIREGIADGSIRPDIDPELTAFTLYGLLNGLFRMVSTEEQHMMKCHHVTAQALINHTFHLIADSLRNPEAPASGRAASDRTLEKSLEQVHRARSRRRNP